MPSIFIILIFTSCFLCLPIVCQSCDRLSNIVPISYDLEFDLFKTIKSISHRTRATVPDEVSTEIFHAKATVTFRLSNFSTKSIVINAENLNLTAKPKLTQMLRVAGLLSRMPDTFSGTEVEAGAANEKFSGYELNIGESSDNQAKLKSYRGRIMNNADLSKFLTRKLIALPSVDSIRGTNNLQSNRIFKTGSISQQASSLRPKLLPKHARFIPSVENSFKFQTEKPRDSKSNTLCVNSKSVECGNISITFSNGEKFVPGIVYSIELKYVGFVNRWNPMDIETGLFYQMDVDDTFSIFSLSQPMGARKIFPCFDDPQFKTSVSIRAITPEGWWVLSGTKPIKTELNFHGRQTIEFETLHNTTSYLISIYALAPSRKFYYVKDKGFEITLWPAPDPDCPMYQSNIHEIVRIIERVLAKCSELFGELPLKKLDVAEVLGIYLGMENTGNILLSNGILARCNDAVYITSVSYHEGLTMLIHEIIHQWFGNIVTMDWWKDIWLNEAFTSYLTDVILEETGTVKNLMAMDVKSKGFTLRHYLVSESHRIPIAPDEVANTPKEAAGSFNFVMYRKGAALLHWFEAVVGRNTLLEFLKHYISKFDGQSINREAFFETLEDWFRTVEDAALLSSKDLAAWLRESLSAKIVPAVSLQRTSNGSNWDVWKVVPLENMSIPVYPKCSSRKTNSHYFVQHTGNHIACPTRDWLSVNTDGRGIFATLYSKKDIVEVVLPSLNLGFPLSPEYSQLLADVLSSYHDSRSDVGRTELIQVLMTYSPFLDYLEIGMLMSWNGQSKIITNLLARTAPRPELNKINFASKLSLLPLKYLGLQTFPSPVDYAGITLPLEILRAEGPFIDQLFVHIAEPVLASARHYGLLEPYLNRYKNRTSTKCSNDSTDTIGLKTLGNHLQYGSKVQNNRHPDVVCQSLPKFIDSIAEENSGIWALHNKPRRSKLSSGSQPILDRNSTELLLANFPKAIYCEGLKTLSISELKSLLSSLELNLKDDKLDVGLHLLSGLKRDRYSIGVHILMGLACHPETSKILRDMISLFNNHPFPPYEVVAATNEFYTTLLNNPGTLTAYIDYLGNTSQFDAVGILPEIYPPGEGSNFFFEILLPRIVWSNNLVIGDMKQLVDFCLCFAQISNASDSTAPESTSPHSIALQTCSSKLREILPKLIVENNDVMKGIEPWRNRVKYVGSSPTATSGCKIFGAKSGNMCYLCYVVVLIVVWYFINLSWKTILQYIK